MPEPKPRASTTPPKSRRRFPWVLLILLLGTIYLFWVWPFQRPNSPVQVEFVQGSK